MAGGYDPDVAADQRVIGQDVRVAEPAGGAAFDAEEAAGRRRRGLLIAAAVAAIGIPLTLVDWWSTREVERRADALAAELLVAARQVEDPLALSAEEITSRWSGGRSRLDAVLGHGDQLAGAALLGDGVALGYEVRYWLETRCVRLLVTVDEVSAEVEHTPRCGPGVDGR